MKNAFLAKVKGKHIPIIVEKDVSGFYVVECPLFSGCYSQGKTIDEALKNVKEAMVLCLQEKENREALEEYNPKEVSLHTIVL